MDMQTVSVIMRFHKRIDFIEQALLSVINQEYPLIEIIIVDDGRYFDIEPFINEKFPQLKNLYFVHQDNQGEAAALNAGLKRSHADYFVILDDDDLLHPKMISTAMDLMCKENADVITVGFKCFESAENPLVTFKQGDKFSSYDLEKVGEIISGRRVAPNNSLLVKKKIVENIGMLDESLRVYDDTDLWLRLLLTKPKIKSIDQCLSFYRRHSGNVTNNKVLMYKGKLRILEKAESYFTEELKRQVNLNREIYYTTLVTGWYVLIYDSADEGRLFMLNACKRCGLLYIPVFFLLIISFLPKRFLVFFTQFSESLLKLVYSYTRA